jgi:hypothetical protein
MSRRKEIVLMSSLTVFLSIIALFFWFSNQESVKAGAEHNLRGWAWSSNIGWISFNCVNEGTCGVSNYGVNVDANGNLSGYAWSSNIGWISFNPLSGCPATTENPDCPPKFDKTTSKVSGWARACAGTVKGDCTGASRTDGWDGWISLKGKASDGSDYGVSVSGMNWLGFAWGGNVVGWISFKGIGYGVIGTDENSQSLVFSGFCQGSPVLPNIGQQVTWTAYPSNGAEPYSYSWSGTDGLSGSTQSVKKIYSTTGIKNASVQITDAEKKTISASCFVEVVEGIPVEGQPSIQPEIKEVAP